MTRLGLYNMNFVKRWCIKAYVRVKIQLQLLITFQLEDIIL